MISKDELNAFRVWFRTYSESFNSEDPDIQKCFDLKRDHTFRVSSLMREIAVSENLQEEDVYQAELIGLFHDLGRFEQFMQYRTFLDAKSVNHAEMAVKIITEKQLFADIPDETAELMKTAILNHNKFAIDPGMDEKSRLFSQMIRDADKLDIYNFSVKFFQNEEYDENDPIMLGTSTAPEMSPEIYNELLSGRMVSKRNFIRTVNDFKLLQISWIYDLNFRSSFRILKEKAYISRIISTLPDGEIKNHVRKLTDSLIL